MFVCEGAYRRDLWWPQVTEVCKTFTPKSLAPDSAAKGFLLHYCTATDSVGSFYFWVLTPFFLTSSRSSFIRSSKSYSFCLSSSFFLLTSKRFFTWSRDDRSTRMDMPRFLWSVGAHTHTHKGQVCVTGSEALMPSSDVNSRFFPLMWSRKLMESLTTQSQTLQ